MAALVELASKAALYYVLFRGPALLLCRASLSEHGQAGSGVTALPLG